jgi:hypothetical protein
MERETHPYPSEEGMLAIAVRVRRVVRLRYRKPIFLLDTALRGGV